MSIEKWCCYIHTFSVPLDKVAPCSRLKYYDALVDTRAFRDILKGLSRHPDASFLFFNSLPFHIPWACERSACKSHTRGEGGRENNSSRESRGIPLGGAPFGQLCEEREIKNKKKRKLRDKTSSISRVPTESCWIGGINYVVVSLRSRRSTREG